MSYLLEALGRGLLADLQAAFDHQLPVVADDCPDTLQARLNASPTSLDLALRLGIALLRESRLKEAQQALEVARTLGPSAVAPHLALACVCDELGHMDQALAHLRTAQRLDPHDPAIAFGIGFCYERMGQSHEARSAYLSAIERCPQLRNAYERLAALAVREHRWHEAIEQYERLAEMEPDDLDVLLTLGNLYLQAHRITDAVEQYQEALTIEPESHDEPLTTAEEMAADGHLDEAIQTLEKLVRKYPNMAPFHVRLGDLYVKVGDDARATESYQVALAAQPSFLEATVKLGTQHMRQGRYVDAAVTFNRAIELNDRLITAFVGLGVAQHDSGRFHESLATFDLAASLEPSTTLLFSESARLHLKTERQDQDATEPEDAAAACGDPNELLAAALQRHEQALRTAPNHADLHYRYGLLLRQVGRQAEAIQAFRNAIRINPVYCKALVKLAICLKEAGDTDEAVTTFQRALSVNDRFVDVHYQLGLLFAQRNRFNLALEEFEQAVADHNQNPSFRPNVALALQNIGMLDRAASTWRSICELGPRQDQLSAREQALRDVNRR
jgi:tetratricopeptide (TPR) repeat protein